MELIGKYFPDLAAMQFEQLAALQNLYVEWNARINVISRKDMENFYERHVLHSLAITKKFAFPGGSEVMDLGTGGGFPGIPLAILFPSSQFQLVDSIGKKLKVARAIADEIQLANISTSHTRAEDLPAKKFDTIVSRAVAPLDELWRWSKPLLRPSTNEQSRGLICLKGGDLKNEIAESKLQPAVYPISDVFEEDFFGEKYILHVKG